MSNATFLTRRGLLVGAGSGLMLAGCSDLNRVRGGSALAGSQIDEGGFGNPTRQNIAIQTGAIEAQSSLAVKFADSVPTMVNFAFGSAELDGAALGIIRQQAEFMRQFPELRFSVYGHTDAVGGNASNLRLGRRRARAVVAALGRYGISSTRLDALVSFGERQLLVQTQARERANRRTVTEVAGFVQGHPLVLDGKYAQIVYRNYVASANAPAPTAGGGLGADG